MSTQELKEQIASKLERTFDQAVLEEVSYILSVHKENEPMIVFTADEIAEVLEAINEDDKGETISHEEVMAQTSKMLDVFDKRFANEKNSLDSKG